MHWHTSVFLMALTPGFIMGQPASAVEFYDTTGTDATMRMGWRGNKTDGEFYLQTPFGIDRMCANDSGISVTGKVSATSFEGDGSGLTGIPIPTLSQVAPHGIGTGDIQDSAVGGQELASSAIVNAHVRNDARIDGGKIWPDFGSRGIRTAGGLTLAVDSNKAMLLQAIDASAQECYLNFHRAGSAQPFMSWVSRSNDNYDNFYCFRGTLALYTKQGSSAMAKLTIGVDSMGSGTVSLHHDRTDGVLESTTGGLKIETATGLAYLNGQQLQTVQSSDRRLKRDIETVSDAIGKVRRLNGVFYRWNDDYKGASSDQRQVGLIAQDVRDVLPEAVTTDTHGYFGVHYEKMVALLVEAIKEQDRRIESQNAALAKQQRAIDELKGMLVRGRAGNEDDL